ncbi:MAG: glycerol-3-phosphate dehydrogenase [Acidimicrobiales bacterium]|jgi:glycerol-3-phosphate dehydrogenase
MSVDVLVIGGGVTGTGVALDAAARGLDVLVVEARDLAAGTSSRSSKLIHGGLRYLEQFNFGLVREALTERGRLVETLCPHLVQPLPFLYPLTHRGWERPYVAAGISIYDGLAKLGGDKLPRQKHFTRTGALEKFPGLNPGALVGAVQYWDAQVDDARHTMMLMRTAASFGASLLTNAEVVSFTGAGGGRVTGAVVHDRETARQSTVNAGVVVNATGVWAEKTEQLAGRPGLSMRASKGVHLVVPRDRIDGSSGIITKTSSSVLFIIPFGHNWLLGTTDTDWEQEPDHPVANRDDVEYVLRQANDVLRRPLTADDVIGVFSGLRPLIAGNEASTSELSREHAVVRPIRGLISITGGKYTTYRVMAADAVDAAVGELGRAVPDSSTATLPLHGANGYVEATANVAGLATQLRLSEIQIERLLKRYGGAITEIAQLITENPAWGNVIEGGAPYLDAEVVLAVRAEGARHIEDVLARRTRLSFDSADRGVAAANRVAELMGEDLGWTSQRRELEVSTYRDRVKAERAAEQMTSDDAAVRARLAATDIRSAAF